MEETDEETCPLLRDRTVSDPEPPNAAPTGLTLRRAIVIPCLVLYFFGLGIYMYVPPQYVQSYIKEHHETKKGLTDNNEEPVDVCHANKTDPSYISYTHVQQESAMWINYLMMASNIPAIFSTIVWTSLSDALGRRFLFILCSSGCVVKLVIVAIVIHTKASLGFLVMANVIDGLTGSIMTMFAVMFTYVADITKTGPSRTIFIVMFELMLGITITISSLVTGFFIKACGFFYPMLACILLTALSVVLMAVFLPETRSNRQPVSFRLFTNYITNVIKIYTHPGSQIKKVKYILLIVSFLLLAIPSLNRGSLETLYQLGQPFCWSSTKIGFFGATKIGLASLLGILGVIGLKKCLADDSIAALAATIAIVSFIVEGMANTDAMLYIVAVISSLTMVPIPMIRSLMSHMTPQDKQGALFAGIGSVETLCNLVGGLTNNLVYSATLTIMNGFVFLLLAMITAAGLLVMLVFMCVRRRYAAEEEEMTRVVGDPEVA